MKIFRPMFVVCLAAFTAVSIASLAQQTPNFAGDYAGMSGPIHVSLHLSAAPDGSLSGTIDSPDQNLFGLPCADIHVNGQGLSFTVPMVRGTWMGFISHDGNSLSGTWSQGQPVPLNLTRVKTGTTATTPASSAGASTPTPSPSSSAQPSAAATSSPASASSSSEPPCPAGSIANYWDGTAWKPMTMALALHGERGVSIKEGLKNPLNPMAPVTVIFRYKDAAAPITLGTSPKFCFPIAVNTAPDVVIGALEVKKNERDIELKRSDKYNSSAWIPARKAFDVNVTRTSDRSFEATPKSPLPAGQYIINNASMTYDFGVQ